MIRKYGPGKFDKHVDQFVYDLCLNGGCDELGDVETFNHYSLVDLGKTGLKEVAAIAKENGDHLTLEESRLLRRSSGAIVEVTSQGFVYVTYFDSKHALDKAWKKLEDEWSALNGDEE